MQPLTVSQLVEHMNAALSGLEGIVVEGEVDELRVIHSKWVVFKLKDEYSSVDCFMTVWQYKTQVEDGMLVRAAGRPTVRNKGFLSFVVSSLQPTGEGALKRAFELLKKKLGDEGLFAPERKRPLPRFPQHLALITSKDAAAYSDFLKVLQARAGGLTISFLHTHVQGDDAPRQLMAALEYANTELADLDVIIMVRGGGSLEDLHAFNDETIVRAVAGSRTPTIVGIGHERDITLAELAADVRASTPSNAAELVVHSREQTVLAIRNLQFSLSAAITQAISTQQQLIARSVSVLRGHAAAGQRAVHEKLQQLAGLRERIIHTIKTSRLHIAELKPQLHARVREAAQRQQQNFMQLKRILDSLSPWATLARGYSITRTTTGKVVKSAAQLSRGEKVRLQFAEGNSQATIGPAPTQHRFDF